MAALLDVNRVSYDADFNDIFGILELNSFLASSNDKDENPTVNDFYSQDDIIFMNNIAATVKETSTAPASMKESLCNLETKYMELQFSLYEAQSEFRNEYEGDVTLIHEQLIMMKLS